MSGVTTLAVLACLHSLGDPDYGTRERATRFLAGAHAAGDLTPLLEGVIAADDLEAARRAEHAWATGMGFRKHPTLLDLPYDRDDPELERAWEAVRCSHRAAASRRGLRIYANLLTDRLGRARAVHAIHDGMERWQSILEECNRLAERMRRRRAFWRIRQLLIPYQHPDPWDDE